MDPVLSQEMDSPLKPLQRARSNTWPLPRPENFEESVPSGSAVMIMDTVDQVASDVIQCSSGLNNGGPIPGCLSIHGIHCGSQMKKNSSRRNAWGNLSYADLITQAITSTPDNRLTLSQIYEWMVHNVPYFKDKGENNSSAGWKNSIRHNLSLHNRFIRVHNEGTGKSSWWMLNPDAKPGKSARRRATSMETSKFEKRRGRVKKKVEALRNGLEPAPSPSSSISETLDLFPDSTPLHGFQLSPDFRTRASSNASSCSRLSPIPSAVEQEWSVNFGNYTPPDQLAGSLEQVMKLNQVESQFLYSSSYPQPSTPSSQLPSMQQYNLNLGQQQLVTSSDLVCSIHQLQQCNCSFRTKAASPCQSSPNSSPIIPFSSSASYQNILDDLNINIENLGGDFECNVDEVIKHELSIEGTLDFNFPNTPTESPTTPPPSSNNSDIPPFNGQSWVH